MNLRPNEQVMHINRRNPISGFKRILTQIPTGLLWGHFMDVLQDLVALRNHLK